MSDVIETLSRKRSVGLIVFLTMVLVSLYACGGGSGNSSSTGDTGFVEINVGEKGGEFDLGNGLKITFPAGAVPDKTTFQFRSLDANNIQLPADVLRQFDVRLLSGFEAKPSGFAFAVPIKVAFTNPVAIDQASIIYPLALDSESSRSQSKARSGLAPYFLNSSDSVSEIAFKKFEIPFSKIIFNLDDTIEIPDLSYLPEDQRGIVLAEIKKFIEESDCKENPCRCGAIEIQSDDFDSSGSNPEGDCYSAYSDGYVKFLNCENEPLEFWSLREADADVFVYPNFKTIEIDESVKFDLSLKNRDGDEINEFSIDASMDKLSVSYISWINATEKSLTVTGVGVGIATGNVILGDSGCQYNGYFTVEIEPKKVIAYSPVSIEEGTIKSIGVKLSDPPSDGANVVVTATESGDEDIVILSGDSLSFNAGNWSSEQFVVIDAAEDDEDSLNGEAVIMLQPDIEIYESTQVTVREIDNDTVNFVPGATALSIPEGGSGYFPIKLNIEPETPVISVITRMGDEDIEVTTSTLTFNASNWDEFQYVKFFAIPDDDCNSGTATVTLGDTSGNVSPLLFGVSEIETDDCEEPPGGNDVPDPGVLHNDLYISEASLNYNNTWARWRGVVPITVTPTEDITRGEISGSGSLDFINAYAFQSYVHPGTELYDTNPGVIVDCYYQAKGTIGVVISGYRQAHVGLEPRYLITTDVVQTNIHEHYACNDGYSSSGEINWLYGNRQFTLENNNDYLDLFFGEQVQYQGELLDKENL